MPNKLSEKDQKTMAMIKEIYGTENCAILLNKLISELEDPKLKQRVKLGVLA